MNHRMVSHMIGQIVTLEAGLMLVPLIVSVCYRERCTVGFLVAIAVALAMGFLLLGLARPKDRVIYAKEGFIIVALAWILSSAVGALPFVISGGIPSYVDAFFETVSGFTTTGASILTDVESLSRGLLFWRSFTHWIGGMGVLVLIVAIMPSDSGRSIHILRAEMAGPVVGKLMPRVRDTAKILYLIYMAMTVLQTVLLLFGGMSLFDALVHAFGTAGTGGFGVKADSVGGYSPYLQWVITIFMLLFGINFNLYYLILLRRFRNLVRNEELWCYICIVFVSAAAIAVNIYSIYQNMADSIRLSSFQVVSIMTTTGFATTDFNLWPNFSKGILLLLMFIGGCAGSTAGGLKVSRIVLMAKSIRRNLRHLLHPHSVGVVRYEGKRIEDETLNSVNSYFALYCLLLAAIFLLLCLEPFNMETNLTAAIACFNNVGPGLAGVGPAASYAAYSPWAKLLLSAAMLLGRLEIYPLLIFLVPSAWRRK